MEDQEAISNFVERMGLSAQGDGLPRIAGRIMGYFIVNGGPTSLSRLAEELQVSRASISTNARTLRDLGVLEVTAVPGDRQDYYQLASRHYLRVLEGYVQRMGVMSKSLETAQDQISTDHEGAHERLADMHRFVRSARQQTRDLIDQLKD